MNNSDYSKEIGLQSTEKRIPWPLALGIIVILGVAAWFAMSKVKAPADSPDHEPVSAPASGAENRQ